MAKHPRTVEELTLLISYLSVIGIWFAIPSVSLLLNKDKRWPIAVFFLCVFAGVLFTAYFLQWKVLFPRSSTEELARMAEEKMAKEKMAKEHT